MIYLIKKIYIKNKELINYLIIGILTTLISLATYFLLTIFLLNPNKSIELQIANILSWIVSVTFAYVTSRVFVFESKNQNILAESTKFYLSRIGTLLIDVAVMFLFVTVFKFDDRIIKIITQVIVIVLNYVFSKILVFKK